MFKKIRAMALPLVSCALAAAVLLGSTTAAATALAGNVLITELTVNNSTGWAYFRIGTTFGASAATCSSASAKDALAFDTKTPEGKSVLSQVEAAMLAGRSVSMLGTNACNPSGVTLKNVQNGTIVVEVLAQFTIQNN
jgi:hypothetical protein